MFLGTGWWVSHGFAETSKVSGAEDSTKLWSLKFGGCTLEPPWPRQLMLTPKIVGTKQRKTVGTSFQHLLCHVYPSLVFVCFCIYIYIQYIVLYVTIQLTIQLTILCNRCPWGIRTMSDTPEGALSVSADWDQDQALVGCGDGTVRRLAGVIHATNGVNYLIGSYRMLYKKLQENE